MLSEGDRAPDFSLPADDGSTVRLSDLKGRKVVLYFYPKDDTPGCTKQACGLRDDYSAFQDLDAVVLGVSPDPVASHVRFRDKYSLPFPLLADTDHEVAEAYGVWKEKTLYGKKHWGNQRDTFVIDEDGKVAKIFRRVKPEQHVGLVLDVLGS
ncbi:MAG TPA: thioredoxin-dependent thiol peroxidase [Longimicrobiales bacterium]|nr:thioredoxin-dependent thiol peroxidase [Longimicrobiales bacterium]